MRPGLGAGDESHLRQVGLPLSALLVDRHPDCLASVAGILRDALVPEILRFPAGPHVIAHAALFRDALWYQDTF
jgi:hypothetical protein